MIRPQNSDQYGFGPVHEGYNNREVSSMLYDPRRGQTFQSTIVAKVGPDQILTLTQNQNGMIASVKQTYEKAQTVINIHTDPSGLTQSCICECMYCKKVGPSQVEHEECNAGIFILLLLLCFPSAFIYCMCVTRYAVHHCSNCGKVLGKTVIS